MNGLPDVLIVTIDTTRADRVSCLGPSSVATPSIDAVARDGTAFLQAVTTAPVTVPAHASLLTARIPPRHGVRSNGGFRLPEREVTLAELLRAHGYRTAAFVGAAVLHAGTGLSQGFDLYDDTFANKSGSPYTYAERPADAVVAAATAWLRGQPPEATFLWVHLFDPHFPYAPPAPERDEHAAAPYDGEIAFADRMVGRLLETYRKLGRYAGAIIVVTSDHGESLGAHGELAHGALIYEPTMHIPLVIKLDSATTAGRVAAPVSIVDVMPTVLDAVGLPRRGDSDGIALQPAMAGEEIAERALYSESLLPLFDYGWAPLYGIRRGAWKLIVGADVELYNVAEDPGETKNVAAARTELAATLTSQMDSVAGPEPLAVDRRATSPISDERAQLLRALGYVSEPALPTWANAASLPSPRKQIRSAVAMDRGTRLFEVGRHDEGITALETLLPDDDANPELHARLAAMYRGVERYADAVREYGRAIALAPHRTRLWRDRRIALVELGEPDVVTRARAMARSGQMQAAVRVLLAAGAETPADPDVWATLAIIHLRDGKTEEGITYYERGLAAGLDDLETWQNLARAYRLVGRMDAAERAERRLGGGSD